MADTDPIQEFMALPHDQQLSTLEQLTPEKQDKLLARVKEYRTKQKQAPPGITAESGDLRAPTERERFLDPNFYPVGAKGESVGENLHNIAQRGGVGVFQAADAVLHPVRTLTGITASLMPERLVSLYNSLPGVQAKGLTLPEGTENPVKSAYKSVEPGGITAVGNVAPLAGQMIAGGAAGEMVGPITRGIAETARKARAVPESVRTASQSLAGAGGRAVKAEVVKAGEAARTADEAHLGQTQEALHETKGRELQHKQAVEAAQDTARRANEELDKQHLQATQKALEETREKEDLYQNELRKAKAESDEAYQKKVAEVNEKRKKAEADRKQELSDYFAKREKIRADHEAAQNAASRKYAIERGVEKIDPQLKSDLEKTEDAVNKEANQKYMDLRKVLAKEKSAPYQAYDEEGHVQGEPVSITEHLYDTAKKELRGTETEPPIISSLGKRTENGELELTYNDLQGYREEVGRALRKGGLVGDVYTGYKKLMTEIDNAMQEIANRHGLGKAQTDARAYYRGYAETFLDHGSPFRKALDSKERGQVTEAFQGMDQSGVERLAKYNPELARRINTVRGLQAEAGSISGRAATSKEPAVPSKPEPVKDAEAVAPREVAQPTRVEPPDRPAPVEATVPKAPERAPIPDRPEQTSVDTQAVREKLVDKWATGESSLNKWQVRALLSGGLSGLVDTVGLLGGHTPGIGSIVLQSGGTMAYTFGPAMVAKLLEKPSFREWITRPPAGELETLSKLPNADRIKITDGLGKVIKQAQAQGIRVSPALTALVGASASVTGPKTKKLQELREQSNAAQ